MKIICRVGCTGLLTDIPLIVAQTKGYFEEADVSVSLSAELGWASIELKLNKGQLSAANVPPSFPVLVALKKGGDPLPLQALAITSYHGEALTLNRETAAAFQAGKSHTLKTIKIGIDAPHALSHGLVRSWLKASRAENLPAIQLVPLAISQLLDLMKDGYIQGFCCAEPLGQIAVEKKLGITVARSSEYPPTQIQSVLAATNEFCADHPTETKALTTALNRARIFCLNPKHEAEILRLYRKHLQSKPVHAGLSFGGSDQTLPLASLIGFELAHPAGHTNPKTKDPLGALATACATSSGVTAAERVVRDTVKQIFSTVH